MPCIYVFLCDKCEDKIEVTANGEPHLPDRWHKIEVIEGPPPSHRPFCKILCHTCWGKYLELWESEW